MRISTFFSYFPNKLSRKTADLLKFPNTIEVNTTVTMTQPRNTKNRNSSTEERSALCPFAARRKKKKIQITRPEWQEIRGSHNSPSRNRPSRQALFPPPPLTFGLLRRVQPLRLLREPLGLVPVALLKVFLRQVQAFLRLVLVPVVNHRWVFSGVNTLDESRPGIGRNRQIIERSSASRPISARLATGQGRVLPPDGRSGKQSAFISWWRGRVAGLFFCAHFMAGLMNNVLISVRVTFSSCGMEWRKKINEGISQSYAIELGCG